MSHGTIFWRCARAMESEKHNKPTCGKEATHFKYGMDRCDEHKIDLLPCVWEANTRNNFPFCGIDHETYGDMYGFACHNSPGDRKEVLESFLAGLKMYQTIRSFGE